MKFTYKKLWKRLIDLDLKKDDLRRMSGISSRTVAKLGHDENVTTDLILKICNALGCRPEDIMEMQYEVGDHTALEVREGRYQYFLFQPDYTALNADHSKLKFIDLFAGIGGIRRGFEMACHNAGLECQCVFTSEIKPQSSSCSEPAPSLAS